MEILSAEFDRFKPCGALCGVILLNDHPICARILTGSEYGGHILLAVADGLARAQAGRLCLHGPPGTGKTAFGRWLAEHLGLPLVVKRASDILDMYVGGTERNIARAFSEASEAGALLLICARWAAGGFWPSS